MGKLAQVCEKFIGCKFPKTVINYRSIKNYIIKSNMQVNKIWGTDLELFAVALLFRTDIWVFTRWGINGWYFQEVVQVWER